MLNLDQEQALRTSDMELLYHHLLKGVASFNTQLYLTGLNDLIISHHIGLASNNEPETNVALEFIGLSIHDELESHGTRKNTIRATLKNIMTGRCEKGEEDAWAAYYLGLAHFIYKERKDAEVQLTESIGLAKSDMLILIGNVLCAKIHIDQGDRYDKAIPFLMVQCELAHKQRNLDYEAIGLSVLVFVMHLNNRYDEAQTIQKQLSKLGEQSSDSFVMGIALISVGHTLLRERRFQEAIAKYKNGVQLLHAGIMSDDDNFARLSALFSGRGNGSKVWTNVKIRCLLKYRHEFAATNTAQVWLQLGISYMGLAVLYRRNDKQRDDAVDLAEDAYQKCLSVSREQELEPSDIIVILSGIANVYREQSFREVATVEYREQKRAQALVCLNEMLQLAEGNVMVDRAFVHETHAKVLMDAWSPGNDNNIQQMVFDEFRVAEELYKSQGDMCRLEMCLLEQAYFHNDCKQFEEAAMKFEQANAIFLQSHMTFGDNDFIGRLLTLEDQKYHLTGLQHGLLAKKVPNVELALVWAERERCRDLLYQISILEKQDQFKQELLSFDTNEVSAWNEIQSICADAGREMVFLIYSKVNANSLISYFLHFDGVFAAIINVPDSCEACEDTALTTEKMVQETLYYIKNNSQPQLQQCLAWFYELLLGKWKKELDFLKPRTIVFVPTKELSLLPFAALYDPDPALPQGERYLIQRYAITNVPSLRLFKHFTKSLQNKSSRRGQRSALVVGNPDLGQLMLSLPDAEGEADIVNKALRSQSFSVKMLTGVAATKTAVLELLPSSDWVHIASHAIVNSRYPNGAVLLANGGHEAVSSGLHQKQFQTGGNKIHVTRRISGAPDAGLEDVSRDDVERALLKFSEAGRNPGALTGKMVENKTLKAMVVVLSACSSGIGQVCAEGVLGLSRSLHMAGVPVTVVSLWNVVDESTGWLMQHFYDNLCKGHGIAVALQQAMKTMIDEKENNSKGDPKYSISHWAPFIVSGIPTVSIV